MAGKSEEDAVGGLSGEDNAADQAQARELEDKIKVLEEESAGLKDQLLRTKADTDNFRKRLLREKQEAVEFGNKELLLDLLPVLDDFERAIKSGEESQDFAAFRDGIALIEKQFTDLLERKWGLKRFVSVGEEFDPQKHEAVYSEQRPDHAVSLVLEDYMKGYSLHERIIRAAKVKISLPAAPQETAPLNEERENTNVNAEPRENPGDAG
ncbi:MAG: nucleotide exchange factor GrpE [Spirochaetales bacterium]|jgi:molecular chaperone GrpE|nr:nucleotide exchange factor GrpE [Spirochaetales bacterium]